MSIRDPDRLSVRRTAGHCGIGMGIVYLCWNGWWLAHLQVPPAMLTSLTGLPSPTTGGTRSLLALIDGDLSRSLAVHPLMIPITALLIWTLVQVAQRRVVDEWVGKAWIGLLLVAWVFQLANPNL